MRVEVLQFSKRIFEGFELVDYVLIMVQLGICMRKTTQSIKDISLPILRNAICDHLQRPLLIFECQSLPVTCRDSLFLRHEIEKACDKTFLSSKITWLLLACSRSVLSKKGFFLIKHFCFHIHHLV